MARLGKTAAGQGQASEPCLGRQIQVNLSGILEVAPGIALDRTHQGDGTGFISRLLDSPKGQKHSLLAGLYAL
jgi:hypothetical protein